MVSHTHHAHPQSHILSILSSIGNCFFWLVVACWFADWRSIYVTVYFIFVVFALLRSMSQTMGQSFPTRSNPPNSTSPDSLSLLMPTLGVGCWVFLSSFSHLRPRPSQALYFLMGYVSMLQRKAPNAGPPKTPAWALHGIIRRRCAESWGHGGCCHGDRGQSRWRVGRQWIILVGCCVWCAVYCGREQFS